MSSDTLCLTIDFINDICDPSGKIAAAAGRVAEGHVIARVNWVLNWARGQGMAIAHVKVGFDPQYRLCPSQSPVFSRARERGALQLGTWGTVFLSELDCRPDEPVIVKHRISAFYETALTPLLTAQDIRSLVIMGVSSENAVELTTREAHDRDLAVTVVSDACASATAEQHEASMAFLARIARVVTVEGLTR